MLVATDRQKDMWLGVDFSRKSPAFIYNLVSTFLRNLWSLDMRKRRWLQFGLRSLLALTLIVSCALPWLVSRKRPWWQWLRDEELARTGAHVHNGCGWVGGGV